MTWQRIDENTYIDDTLITCAEYQLFIDEMREQEKYYQPDHWSSYHFPEGQARQPILGVRHKDAIVFCEWLTDHNSDKWKYHLPEQKEAITHSIQITNLDPLGYWVAGDDEQSNFIWVSNILNDARKIKTMHPHDFDGNLNRYLAYAIDQATSRDNNDVLADLLREAINLAYNRPLDFERFRIIDPALGTVFELLPNSPVEQPILRAIDYLIGNDHTLSFERIFSSNKVYSEVHRYKRVISWFVDIYTLQERMAGRSPAFEGIRLVKERTH